MSVQVESSVLLQPPQTATVDPSTGIAYFAGLRFASVVPSRVQPTLTFSVKYVPGAVTYRVLPISTGLITVVGSTSVQGVDVVAEVLQDFETFDINSWIARVCGRFNVEVSRIEVLRVFAGMGGESPQLGESTINVVKAAWQGTRITMRFVEPLPTSRNTISAADLAEIFLALRPGCLTGDLFLRRTFALADDKSCDWYVYSDQLSGALQCIETAGRNGYCACHVPMMEEIGMKCLGFARMTTLCLDTLLQRAQCKNPEITRVCRLLEFPDTPRYGVVASGIAVFLMFPPILYLYLNGFFHKLNRPLASAGAIRRRDFVAADESDML